MLPYTTVKLVKETDLNDLINEHVPMIEGAKYCYQQAYECGNDTLHWFDVPEPGRWTDEDEAELGKLMTWGPVKYGAEWGRDCPCDLDTIMQYLSNKGLVEPTKFGEWKLHVSW